MTHKTGVGKTGKPYEGYVCPETDRNQQCKAGVVMSKWAEIINIKNNDRHSPTQWRACSKLQSRAMRQMLKDRKARQIRLSKVDPAMNLIWFCGECR
jgi:hypothetical protein